MSTRKSIILFFLAKYKFITLHNWYINNTQFVNQCYLKSHNSMFKIQAKKNLRKVEVWREILLFFISGNLPFVFSSPLCMFFQSSKFRQSFWCEIIIVIKKSFRNKTHNIFHEKEWDWQEIICVFFLNIVTVRDILLLKFACGWKFFILLKKCISVDFP